MIISTGLTYDTVPETTFQPIGAPHAPLCYRYIFQYFVCNWSCRINSISVCQSVSSGYTYKKINKLYIYWNTKEAVKATQD